MIEIDGVKWYRPKEIAKLGLLRNFGVTKNVLSSYNFILELIKTGKLEAHDYGNGQTPYYAVSEKAIKKYKDNLAQGGPHGKAKV